MLNIAPVIRVINPIIRNTPPMVSANAMGICSSGGSPKLIRCCFHIGSNFCMPYTKKIAPTDALIPQ